MFAITSAFYVPGMVLSILYALLHLTLTATDEGSVTYPRWQLHLSLKLALSCVASCLLLEFRLHRSHLPDTISVRKGLFG